LLKKGDDGDENKCQKQNKGQSRSCRFWNGDGQNQNKIENPGVITSIITKEAADDLGIKEGDSVIAIIKSTEVMVGKE